MTSACWYEDPLNQWHCPDVLELHLHKMFETLMGTCVPEGNANS
jgi:hypothetical protein